MEGLALLIGTVVLILAAASVLGASVVLVLKWWADRKHRRIIAISVDDFLAFHRVWKSATPGQRREFRELRDRIELAQVRAKEE